MTEIDLWLRDLRIAELSESGGRIDLRWTEEAANSSLGLTLLSLNLPVSEPDRPPHHRKVRPYLAGLLPEPNTTARNNLEKRVGRTGILDLLLRSGGDVAGAVRFCERGEQPPTGSVERISDDDVASLLSDPQASALIGGGSSDALPGVQHKIVLRRMEDGSWGIARHGASSTHILKPRNGALSLELEAFGSAVSQAAGLTQNPSWIQKIGGAEALVIPRYDRQVRPDGTIACDHQEDFAQALGLSPDTLNAKFQRGGRYPSLAAMATMLKNGGGDAQALARMTALNVMLCNTDAHAKNHSVLLDERGLASLAPAYDISPLLSFRQPRFALDIGGESLVDQVDEAALRAELRSWAGRAAPSAISAASGAVRDLIGSDDPVALALPGELLESLDERAAEFCPESGAPVLPASLQLRAGSGPGRATAGRARACSAPTESGGVCGRRVATGQTCWQHPT